jgi:hypothetical protein
MWIMLALIVAAVLAGSLGYLTWLLARRVHN